VGMARARDNVIVSLLLNIEDIFLVLMGERSIEHSKSSLPLHSRSGGQQPIRFDSNGSR
jgi:hypothetical protein